MKKYYFTFGSFGSGPNEDKYVVIEAESPWEARAEMARRYGEKWAFGYESAEEAGVKEFNLTELK